MAISHPESVALLDDAEARMAARTFNVPLMGSLGLVIRARRLGHIDSASSVLRALRQAGLYLSDKTVRHVLAEVVSEEWDIEE